MLSFVILVCIMLLVNMDVDGVANQVAKMVIEDDEEDDNIFLPLTKVQKQQLDL